MMHQSRDARPMLKQQRRGLGKGTRKGLPCPRQSPHIQSEKKPDVWRYVAEFAWANAMRPSQMTITRGMSYRIIKKEFSVIVIHIVKTLCEIYSIDISKYMKKEGTYHLKQINNIGIQIHGYDILMVEDINNDICF